MKGQWDETCSVKSILGSHQTGELQRDLNFISKLGKQKIDADITRDIDHILQINLNYLHGCFTSLENSKSSCSKFKHQSDYTWTHIHFKSAK